MAKRDDIIALVEAYVVALGRQDLDAVLASFTDDAVQDDPVGEGHNVGHAQIRAFFEQSFSVTYATRLDGPVGVHGDFAAFRFVIEIPAGRTPFRVLVVDLAQVARGADGAWRFANLRSVPDSVALN